MVFKLLFKVPISSIFFSSNPIFHEMNFGEKNQFYDLDEKRFFYEFLKIWKYHFLADHMIHMLRVVT